MTRKQHMDWCKQRALEYCDRGDVNNALNSMLSDLTKHDETRNHAGIDLMTIERMSGRLSSVHDVRKFIEGFN